jgi:ADP-heptose:LPS heptosyltransferase
MIRVKKTTSLNAAAPQKILLINTGDLGDNILTLRFIAMLINSDTFSPSVLCKHTLRDLYVSLYPQLTIIPWNKKKYRNNIFYKVKYIKKLRCRKYNIAFNVTPERGILNEELVQLSGADQLWKFVKKDAFIINPIKHFLDNKYNRNFRFNRNEIDILEDTGKVLGLQNDKIIRHLRIQSRKKVICIAPFSSDPKRNWDVFNYKELTDKLSCDYKVILLGKTQSINKKLNFRNDNCLDLIGKTSLHDLPTIIKDSRLFIGNDSGLTHLALNLEVPLIAIIGGGMYNRFFPYAENELQRYLFHQMDCFGCSWNCIYKERYCITKVTVNEVLCNAFKILESYEVQTE